MRCIADALQVDVLGFLDQTNTLMDDQGQKERETLNKKIDAEIAIMADYTKFLFNLFIVSSGGTGALVVQGKSYTLIYFGVVISFFILIFAAILTLARIRRTKRYE